MFSKAFFSRGVKSRNCVVKGYQEENFKIALRFDPSQLIWTLQADLAQYVLQMHCEKKNWLSVFSPFPTMSSKAFTVWVVKTQGCLDLGQHYYLCNPLITS